MCAIGGEAQTCSAWRSGARSLISGCEFGPVAPVLRAPVPSSAGLARRPCRRGAGDTHRRLRRLPGCRCPQPPDNPQATALGGCLVKAPRATVHPGYFKNRFENLAHLARHGYSTWYPELKLADKRTDLIEISGVGLFEAPLSGDVARRPVLGCVVGVVRLATFCGLIHPPDHASSVHVALHPPAQRSGAEDAQTRPARQRPAPPQPA